MVAIWVVETVYSLGLFSSYASAAVVCVFVSFLGGVWYGSNCGLAHAPNKPATAPSVNTGASE